MSNYAASINRQYAKNIPFVAWQGEWQDVIDEVTGPREAPYARRRVGSAWDGGEKWAEIVERVTWKGYDEAVPLIEGSAAFIEQAVIGDAVLPGFESQYDVCGSDVDITRYLNGEPECMTESVPLRLAKQGRIVTLIVHIGVSGGIESTAIRNRGAAIAALSNVLLLAQHPLEVWVMDNYPTKKHNGCVLAKVQDASQPLDKARILFALAHPAALRGVFFDIVDGLKTKPGRSKVAGQEQGYGPVVDMVPEHFTEAGFTESEVVYIPQLEDEWRAEGLDYAVEWVECQLARLNISVT